MRTVAVTGGRGMIGRRVVQRLLVLGVRVKVLSRSETLYIEGAEVVIGDIASESTITDLLTGADCIFHCAAEIHDVEKMYKVNTVATKKLAVIAEKLGVSCFIHMSSAGVIGPTKKKWINETTECTPVNTYEKSKWEAEIILSEFHCREMRLVMLRPTNVVDAQRPGVVIMGLRKKWRDIVALIIKGNENAHIVHADDVAAAAIYCAFNESQLAGIFFVSCDEDQKNTISKIYQKCQTEPVKWYGYSNFCLPVNIPYIIRGLHKGKSLHGHSRFSSEKLCSTGFKYPLGLDGGITEICSSIKS